MRSWLDPRGRVGRGRYAALGVALALAKYNLDRLIAGLDGRYWAPDDYFSPSSTPLLDLPRDDATLFAVLVAVSLPFIWIGIALTLRRLRDAGLPAWLAAVFFVPVANVVFFAVLSVVPTREREERPSGRRLARVVPRSDVGSAALAVVVTAAAAVALLVLGVGVLETYGWGVFVGIPFAVGLVAALLHGYHEPRGLGECVSVAMLACGIAGGLLLGLALEGAICLIMAAPLAGALAVLGGVVGYLLQRRSPAPLAGPACVALLVLPGMLGVEAHAGPEPPVAPVRTSVVVDAPPSVVWRHVVAFTELPPPEELLFRLGIAYPVSAQIEGTGVGAVRRCRFSTGDFVEPITAWEEPRRLAFGVTAQPRSLNELSPWDDVRPPHVEGFLVSRRGEFRLEPLPGGRTRLVGTTWYENRMWPGRYWRLWSDALIHRIHRRVLRHVARSAETDARNAPGSSVVSAS
jgi:uncharacterized membrane protein YhaH (DUF805 family)